MRLTYKLTKSILMLLIAGLFGACNSDTPQKEKPMNSGRVLKYPDKLHFINDSGEVLSTIRYATADDPEERNQGLMDVRSMPEDAGMVFFFEVEEAQSFWMASTPLPLDIMYVNADSVIVTIYQNTKPYSQETLPSFKPAQYVIETNGGYSVTHDIREGMKVRF